jgi:subtilisin family serine protease
MTYLNKFIVYVDTPEVRDTLLKHGSPGLPTALTTVIIFKTDLTKEEVERIPGVAEVEQDSMNEPSAVQPSPRNWFLPSSSNTAPDYVYNKTGEGVAIYVMDSGIRSDHSEFDGRETETIYTYDGLDYGGVNNSVEHGMMAATCAAGNQHGIAKKASVFSMRYDWSFSDGIKALDTMFAHYKANTRPAVLSMSWSSVSNIYNRVFTELSNAGVVLVASAGNDGEPQPRWPAQREDVIAVAACDRYLKPSVWNSVQSTNYGPQVDIWAGGTAGLSGSIRTRTATQTASGTSSACPLVAGNVALLLEGREKLSTYSDVMNVKRELLEGSRKGVIQYTDEKYLSTPNRYIYTLAEDKTPDEDPVLYVREPTSYFTIENVLTVAVVIAILLFIL